MLSDMRLQGGDINMECLEDFPHLQSLICKHIKFNIAYLPSHHHLCSLTLSGCSAFFIGIAKRSMVEKLPNLRILRLKGFEVSAMAGTAVNYLLKTETIRYLKLSDFRYWNMAAVSLPPHLLSLSIEDTLLQTVQILQSAPNLRTLQITKHSRTAKTYWPLRNFDMTSLGSISDVELSGPPYAGLSLLPTVRLTLHDFEIGSPIEFEGFSSLSCIVLKGIHDLRKTLQPFLDSLAVVEDLTISGNLHHYTQHFKRLPKSLRRFTVQHMTLSKPAAILKAEDLVELTIADCQIEGRLVSTLKLKNLQHLRNFTSLRTPVLEGLHIPHHVRFYHHDH